MAARSRGDACLDLVGILRMPITITDVAKLAGVSKGTVSKVLNDAPGVRAQTRERILKVIEDLNYEPNASAQSLAAKRTDSVGVIFPHTGGYTMSSAFWPILLTSITDKAAARNLTVVLSTARSEEDVDSAYRSILRGRRVDGLIVSAEQFGQKQLAELLLKGFPFVMVGRSRFISHYYVDVDNAGGASNMTKHLIEMGHRRIVMLAGPEHFPSVQERVEGFRTTMAAAGFEAQVHHSSYQADVAARKVEGLLAARPRPTALFVAAGDLTTAALGTASGLGLSVPSDLALVTFGDHPFYAYFSPAITAVSQPIHELGEAAVDLLFTLMDGREPERASCILPTTLVIRQSCGCRP
jgi:DNA-binding LacI/PurR family transcriptional regulator